ncbi:VOC family protein [Serratia microhaemolytica]|uniref:VOC family protein n=1 Tax=Serratia microhaemolytica TaxID=2675110 RepID=UPI000FDCF417|nr:VOC family protein [Serratia microhaemolytica]
MSNNNFTSVFSVLHVNDFDAAVEWYVKWLGRKPDVTPDEGIAEWQLTENAWIQVSMAPEPNLAGKSFVVCGVRDIEVQRAICQDAGVSTSEIQDLGFIKLAQISDPAGNTVMFVQEM